MIDVSWVGKIPSHWDVVPLKSKFQFVNQQGPYPPKSQHFQGF